MKYKLSSLLFVGVFLCGCTSAPPLPDTWSLNTTPKTQNYFYCASCPKPSKLVHQVYQPLEPDTPVIVAKPVAEPVKVVNHLRSRKKVHKKRIKHKKVQYKPKQCIQWSN